MRLYFVGIGLIIVFGAIATAYLGSSTGSDFFLFYLAAFVLGIAFVVLGAVLPPAAAPRPANEVKVAEKQKEETGPVAGREANPAAMREDETRAQPEVSVPRRDYKSRDYSDEGDARDAAGGQPTERYVYTTDGRKKKIEKPAKKGDAVNIDDIKGISHHKKADMDISRKDGASSNCPQCGSPNEPNAKSCSSCGYRLIP
ncbi:MAG: zinc ribbon domain-containing protein [Candidatus Micrarchaeota archaeon]|nr:zinc ribbon domain-containing protein [Candidatus Micrarchaeota archaeon]